MTDKRKLDEWVDDYGEDSDFLKVRVRGEFPSASSMQFIPSNLVEVAQEREVKSYSHVFTPRDFFFLVSPSCFDC
jgi:hypothetical protein